MSTQRKMACIIGMAVMISATCILHLWAQDPLHGWQAENEGTHGIVLASVDESEMFTSFSFKNVSKKVVTAFVISFSGDQDKNGFHYLDCFDAEQACLVPGTTYSMTLRTTSLNDIPNHTIPILAILYADGSSEGSSLDLQVIASDRLGKILETERIKDILTSSTGSTINDVESKTSATQWQLGDEDVKSLEQAIGSLPQSTNQAIESVRHIRVAGASVDNLYLDNKAAVSLFHAGVSWVRQNALRQVNELRQSPTSPQGTSKRLTRAQYFSQLRQEYEALSAKHREYYKRAQRGLLQ